MNADPLNGTVFYKMSGSGNDFVFVDGRGNPASVWTAQVIQDVCRPHTGVGADGLAIVEPGSKPGAIRLQYFNSDGGRASLCGNSALCATRLSTATDYKVAFIFVRRQKEFPRCVAQPGVRAS